MPNWVYNVVKVMGNDKEAIVEFLKQHIKDNLFDFNTIIPEPEDEQSCPREYNFNKNNGRFGGKGTLESTPDREWFNWYDWRIDNWGTKWNSGGGQYFDYDGILKSEGYIEIAIHFQTAWSMPMPVLKKLLEMHPELYVTVEYYSTENGECGGLYVGFDNEGIIHYRWKLDDYFEETLI